MRDWLATLLQVSFAAKSCDADLEQCVAHWAPLLGALASKQGKSASEVLSDMVLKIVYSTHEFEMNTHQIKALELPSKNDEMGTSLIEERLDDHTLGHVFSFLDCKDVCTAVERVSHRFLQCSRNRMTPFALESFDWGSKKSFRPRNWWIPLNSLISFIPNRRVSSPLAPLLQGFPESPKSVLLRSVHRFRIERFSFSPESLAFHRQFEDALSLADVIPALAPNVQSCYLSIDSETGDDCVFPAELSHVQYFYLQGFNAEYLEGFCNVYSNCESLKISLISMAHWSDLSPINKLTKLQRLEVVHATDIEVSRDDRTALDPTGLTDLRSLIITSSSLPFFARVLNSQIESLHLCVTEQPMLPKFMVDLSDIKNLTLSLIRTRSQSISLRRNLKFSSRVSRMNLCIQKWDILLDWVDCADQLVVDINGDTCEECGDEWMQSMMHRWKVEYCVFRLFSPGSRNLIILCKLLENIPDTKFDIYIRYQQTNKDIQTSLDELKALTSRKSTCYLRLSRFEIVKRRSTKRKPYPLPKSRTFN